MPTELESRPDGSRRRWRDTEQPDSDELVDLGDGQRVPRRFQQAIYASDTSDIELLVTLVMDGTRARVADVLIKPIPGVDSLGVDDLARINWSAVVRLLVQLKVMQTSGWMLSPGEAKTLPAGAVTQRLHDRSEKASRAAKRTMRRNAVTAEDLAEIVRLVDTDGIAATVEKTGKSRGYIYKLLARAREEL